MKYEEAINLKPGTPILIRSKVVSVDAAGDILYETHAHSQEYEVMHAKIDHKYVDIQTPEQKLDDCRLFKKGDKVRVVEWNGRDIARVGRIGYVVSDEYNSRVELAIAGWKSDVFYPACHLELVTPIEVLEPYSIDPANTNILLKDGKKFATFEADADTKTMCDRLNDECRKEHEND